MLHPCISALKVSTFAPPCIIPSFLSKPLIPPQHTAPCILPSLSPASIFFPISLSQGPFSTFHYHSLTELSFWTPLVVYRCLFKSLHFLTRLKNTRDITSITSCIFLTRILLFNVRLPVSPFCLNTQLSALITLRSALVPKHELAG